MMFNIHLTAVISTIITYTANCEGARTAVVPHPMDILLRDDNLPKDQQVSVFLRRGETRRLSLTSDRPTVPLTLTVTPCSSKLYWSLYHAPVNRTSGQSEGNILLAEYETDETQTYHTPSAKQGKYILHITSMDSASYVSVSGSSEQDMLDINRPARLRLQRRQRPRRVTALWDKSPIDPHVSQYCLVVSTRKSYGSLCSAQSDKYGLLSPSELNDVVSNDRRSGHSSWSKKSQMRPRAYPSSNTSKMSRSTNSEDLMITCVGSKTHHTVDNLQQGKTYYFTVFTVRPVTPNLDLRSTNWIGAAGPVLATGILKYEKKNEPTRLRDGRPKTADLRALDGKALFRFKPKAKSIDGDSISLAVLPCGGAVDVDVLKGRELKLRKKRIDSYVRLQIPEDDYDRSNERYLIRVVASNQEELNRLSGVEVVAGRGRLPLAELPSRAEVREFVGLRACKATTIGWLPARDKHPLRYCIMAREIKEPERGRKRSMPMDYTMPDAPLRAPNQCSLEKRMRKSADFEQMHCKDSAPDDDKKSVMTHRLTGLKPGKRYLVQVTVKKSGGKTLSYDLLPIATKTTCN